MELTDAPSTTDTPSTTDAPAPVAGSPAVVDDGVRAAVRAACGRIAPLWPLERFVAVNPYLGLRDHRFAEAAERLATTAGAHGTLPIAFYLAALDEGRIGPADLEAALAAQPSTASDVDTFVRLARADDDDDAAWAARVPTVADVAAERTGRDWPHLATERVAAWAAAHFDGGQAIWRSTDRHEAPYAAWRAEARIDRTPEVMGLRGFRAAVRSLPADPQEAVGAAIHELRLPAEGLELYLHRLLLRVGGWAAHAARIGWEAGLRGEEDDTVLQLLAVQLSWEVGVLRCLAGRGVPAAWDHAKQELRLLGDAPEVRGPVARRLVLQDAFDRAEQRRLIEAVAARPASPPPPPEPRAQAIFCIDVRSEVYRRNLEAVAPDVETLGFAGFFGFPLEVVPLAHDEGEAQCPVLLTPGFTVEERVPGEAAHEAAVASRRLKGHVRRAWKSFKMGAISCFSFVGPVGLVYLPKMLTDASGRTRPVPRPEDDGLRPEVSAQRAPVVALPLEDRVAMAEGALRAMSLTSGFAPVVLVCGHGATTVNNPYDTGLDCGACGGHTGEANARVAAATFNDPEVRRGLAERGIEVPESTWFVPAQHNTTTDEIELFDRQEVPPSAAGAVAELELLLAQASRRTRAERAPRLGIGVGERVDEAVLHRARDWAQVRPEWGLAGCRAFIVAPRTRTQDLDLGGRSFLHSYDWRQDEGFGVLELIMTAPMVVASWISLQYYASTVDNRLFGSGNKVLHNVVGKLGVLEGTAGDLRVGLPWQSVHDGERYQHEPVRLKVVIEAPIDAMNDVLRAHPDVKELVDHGWLHLLAMDDEGRISHRYAGELRWEPVA